MDSDIIVRIATVDDEKYAKEITDEMLASAIVRGSGISKRSPESICKKIREGKAVIALTNNNCWVGFSYIETWSNGDFVSNSGLIVHPSFRNRGIASDIKKAIFELSRSKYPDAKIFSITTGLAIMKMNAALGFQAVTYSEITEEETFWQGCKSCINYDTLQQKKCKVCFCTAMLFNPVEASAIKPNITKNCF